MTATDFQWQLEVKGATGEASKGGPGSGHHGHAGRPGKRGGSMPGKGGSSAGGVSVTDPVDRSYFESGPGKQMLQELPQESRHLVIEALTDSKVQARHIDGLTRFTTELPPGYKSWWRSLEGEGIGQVLGKYDEDTGTIYLNPKSGARSWNTIMHELGHHVAIGSRWRTTEGAWLLSVQAGAVAGAEWKNEYRRMGLDPHSFLNAEEIMADAFRVWTSSGPSVQKRLAEFLDVGSLDEVFGSTE